jgi:hypothetical protein
MQIPGYDAWRLRGPEEVIEPDVEDCKSCEGFGTMIDNEGEFTCIECDGVGEVEVTLDEPDGDYEYERRRDAEWGRT